MLRFTQQSTMLRKYSALIVIIREYGNKLSGAIVVVQIPAGAHSRVVSYDLPVHS